MTLDYTLQMLDRLRQGGFPETQARSVAVEISRITEILATKADLEELRTELKGDIIQVRNEVAEVKGEIAQLRGEVARL